MRRTDIAVVAARASYPMGSSALRGKPLARWCRRDVEDRPVCHGDAILPILARFLDDGGVWRATVKGYGR